MARIIQGDPTQKELQQPPESAHEANVQFYTPSTRYRTIANFIDKDLVLSNLGQLERREVILIIRILLNAVKLEDSNGWTHANGEPNTDLSDYWLKRLAATTVTTRAIDGQAAKLSRTHISDEKLSHTQTMNTGKGRSPIDFMRPKGGN